MDKSSQSLSAQAAGCSNGGMIRRVRITIGGRVQGVGFRPSVYRHAAAVGVTGFVRNTHEGVEVQAQGTEADVHRFLALLRTESPRQAHVESMVVTEIATVPDENGFQIVPSTRSGDLVVGFPPDLALCSECLRELWTPTDRRYRYPFINCVNCGPRFTIISGLPYDRGRTSMAVFRMCPMCQREYEDPTDRRFDAQPNACPVCGPSVWLVDADGTKITCEDPIREAAERLKRGEIVAIKGLGGYHLACDACDDEVVATLRLRKGRRDKPFAVMFRNLEQLRQYAEVTSEEVVELLSPASPIVVVARKPNSRLSRFVAPDTDDVGGMLPYTPLHHLLLAEIGPLVMTSGNVSEEPIVHDESSLERILGRIADSALIHNRTIVRRCDDSVVKMVRGKRMVLRRARGFVPQSVLLPWTGPSVLAVGGDSKNTFCLTKGNRAFLSQHIGDLDEHPSIEFFLEALQDLMELLGVKPKFIAHDLHPAYESTRFALSFPPAQRLAVQHHHAHIASCMVEHGLAGKVLGVAWDGLGLGTDRTLWGGEFLLADYIEFQRVGHLLPFALPGGDSAVRNPVRCALGLLATFYPDTAYERVSHYLPALPPDQAELLLSMVREGFRAPLTTSVGRLFDAVAALLGLVETITYEGQGAVRLMACAKRGREARTYSVACVESETGWILDPRPMLDGILRDIEKGVAAEDIAYGFHLALARGAAEICAKAAEKWGVSTVALSGGVFQNDLLLARLVEAVSVHRLDVYWPHGVPPNDGGLSLGQAAIAVATAREL